jgi:hypothetical protein
MARENAAFNQPRLPQVRVCNRPEGASSALPIQSVSCIRRSDWVGLTEDHQNRQTPSAVVARHHPAALDIRAANMSSFLDLAYRET